SGSGASIDVPWSFPRFFRDLAVAISSPSSNWLNLHLPTLGCGHAGAIGAAAHEPAGWRTISDKKHPLGHFALLAMKGGFAEIGSHPDLSPGRNSQGFHVFGVHRQCVDNRLILGAVLAHIDLLSLLGRAAGVE